MNGNSLHKEPHNMTAGVNFFHSLPVVEQYVGAFDVSVEEVVFMAVVQTLQQLAHEAADVLMGELDQAWLQQTHQVMVHVLKHQVKGT